MRWDLRCDRSAARLRKDAEDRGIENWRSAERICGVFEIDTTFSKQHRSTGF